MVDGELRRTALGASELGGCRAMNRPAHLYGGYVFDLDGTVYLGDELLPGARETLAALRDHGPIVYLTNKPLETPADYAAKLTRLGIDTSARQIVSSTDALLLYLARLAPGVRIFPIAE